MKLIFCLQSSMPLKLLHGAPSSWRKWKSSKTIWWDGWRVIDSMTEYPLPDSEPWLNSTASPTKSNFASLHDLGTSNVVRFQLKSSWKELWLHVHRVWYQIKMKYLSFKMFKQTSNILVSTDVYTSFHSLLIQWTVNYLSTWQVSGVPCVETLNDMR